MVGFRGVAFAERVCGARSLRYDEACVEVVSDEPVSLWTQYVACRDCDLLPAPYSAHRSLVVRSGWPMRFSARDAHSDPLCNGSFTFAEYGFYNLHAPACSLELTQQPDEPLVPLLLAIIIMLSAATLWYLIKGLYRRLASLRFFRRIETSELLIGSPNGDTPARLASTRLKSVDVFRGITIALMIFVNYGGGGYTLFHHSPWNGMTVADVVFPWFAWLMGFALCLSLHTRLRTTMKRKTAFVQILKRSMILIIVGVILSSKGSTIERIRLPGVLQRLGLSYLLVGTLECFFMNPSNNYSTTQRRFLPAFRDMRSTLGQWSGTILFVAVQVAVTFTLPIPGCPIGYLGPGGLHNHSSAKNCTGGATAYIDTLIIGRDHMYKKGTFRQLYRATSPFDPEGLLGTLTCALVVQLGVQAARVLLANSHARSRILRWIFWGTVTGVTAGGLCKFSENDGLIPINKNLWSVSYCLATSSLAFVFLAMLYIIIDVYPIWQGRPFYYAGRNALLLYIGHDLMKGRFPFEWELENPSHMELLFMNLWAVILWLSIAIFLHRKNVILTV